MAMLVDGPPSTIDELKARDSELIDVCASEGLDVTAKLKVAANDIGLAIEGMLLSSAPKYAAVRPCLPSTRQIAVTPELKRWHLYMTLRLTYEDLYGRRLNERYQEKAKVFAREEASSVAELRVAGVGVVLDPLPRAVAPNVAKVQSANQGGTMYVAISFTNQKREEGLASDPIQVDTADGQAAYLTLISLAENATGWNVYAGLAPGALALQNSSVLIPLGNVTIAPDQLKPGRPPGSGQRPNLMIPMPRRILRG